MMTIEPNDPRLTDYVLGELADDERRQIEQIIASDESVRASVDAIREMTGMLETELSAEPGLSFSDEQREAIAEGRATSPFAEDVGPPIVMTPRKRFFSLGAGLSGMAATFLAGLFVASGYNAWNQSNDRNPTDLMALHNEENATGAFDDANPSIAAPSNEATTQSPASGDLLGKQAAEADGSDASLKPDVLLREQELNARSAGGRELDDRRGRGNSAPAPTSPVVEEEYFGLPELHDAAGAPVESAESATPRPDSMDFESITPMTLDEGLAVGGHVTIDADALHLPADATDETIRLVQELGQVQAGERFETLYSIQPNSTEPPLVGVTTADNQPAADPAIAGVRFRGFRGPEGGGGAVARYNEPSDARAVGRRRAATAESRQDNLDFDFFFESGDHAADGLADLPAEVQLELQDMFGEQPSPERTREIILQEHANKIRAELGDESEAVSRESLREIAQQLEELQQQLKDEEYQSIPHNPFHRVLDQPQSTFSVDVDTGAYSNMRRYITRHGMLPPAESVRIEEMINYFDYDYEAPADSEGDPFTVHVDVAACPWNAEHRLAKIGLKGYEVPANDRPPTNLVYLLDVSGSMNDENKLPLLKKSFIDMVGALQSDDRVAIVVYAGASGLVLDSVDCFDKQPIIDALSNLKAGGSTNGGAGIELAYKVATDNFIEGGSNRVILATDGDFNVGMTKDAGLFNLIEEKAETGVFLSVLGYGMGNLKDGMLEQLADKGNGNYAYIDTYAESRKVLVDEISSTLVTIAKDVKLQVEFNPATVAGYRLIGYENRVMAARDFNDDTKDAGEIGAGHTVTALYEIIPAGEFVPPAVNELKYQRSVYTDAATSSDELFTVNLRYKRPDEDISNLIEIAPLRENETDEMSEDFAFASAVAAYGMILRNSPYMGETTFDLVESLANQGLGEDKNGYRAEFLNLVSRARELR